MRVKQRYQIKAVTTVPIAVDEKRNSIHRTHSNAAELHADKAARMQCYNSDA
jgi:hypothetical protein